MNPLEEAAYRAAEYGGGPAMVIDVPDSASIAVGDSDREHMLDGAVISMWR